MASLAQELIGTLQHALSPDLGVRQAAEEHVARLGASNPDFSPVLAALMIDTSVDTALRQLAGVVLRQYVDAHWSQSNEERFVPPEIPPEAKTPTRIALLQALVDPNSKIRSMAAFTTAIIAQHDWPGFWPDLFDNLLSALFSDNPHAVHGSLRVLSEFVQYVSEDHLGRVMPLLLPKLYQIASDEARDLRTRGRAITIFATLAETVATVALDDKSLLQHILPQLEHWLRLLGNMVSSPASDWGLRANAVSVCTVLFRALPKNCSKLVSHVLGPVWGMLSSGAAMCTQSILAGDELPSDGVDEEGELLNFEQAVVRVFEFLDALVEQQALRKHLKSHLVELVNVTIAYIPMTDDQMELWASDPDQYVEDEAEETFTCSLRVLAEQFLENLMQEFESLAAAAVEAAVQGRVHEALAARAAGSPAWWKLLEAAIIAFMRASGEILNNVSEGKSSFDLAGFLSVLAETCSAPEPYLRSCGLLVAGICASHMPVDLKTTFFSHLAVSVQPGMPVCVQVGALRGIAQFCKSIQAAEAPLYAPHMAGVLEGLIAVATHSSQEVVWVVMETLCITVGIAPEVTVACEKTVLPFIIAVFIKMFEDHVMAEIVVDAFAALASIPAMLPHIEQRALPTLLGIIQQHANPSLGGLAAAAVDAIAAVVKRTPSPLAEAYLRGAFVTVVRAAMASPDATMMQNCGECVRMFVCMHSAQLLSWSDGQATGMQYILQVLAHLLHPDQPDSAAVFVGRLVRAVISKAGPQLSAHIRPLLSAVLERLQRAQTLTLIQSLILVFAQLMLSDSASLIPFLVETNAVTMVVTKWCDNYNSFYGSNECKLSALAAAKLVLEQHAMLDTITVQGDEIAGPGIRTRSKQGQPHYQMIPATLKFIKLLIGEYGSVLAKVREAPGDEEEIVDDDEDPEGAEEEGDWEDEDAGEGLARKSPFVEALTLSDVLDLGMGMGMGDEDDDDEDDETERDDSIAAIDLKSNLENMFRVLSSTPVAAALAPRLTGPEQRTLALAFQSPPRA